MDFVEVEAGMNAGNKRHVSFEALKDYLESRSYLLFGIYGQVHEWPTKKPHLRRTNPVFVSRRMIGKHKGVKCRGGRKRNKGKNKACPWSRLFSTPSVGLFGWNGGDA